MALQNQPDFIPQPFAANGDKNEISAISTTNGLASWVEGFNTINSLPLAAGGVAPSRLDFNGMFNVLSQFAMFAQQGGLFAWDETQDYGASAIVQASDGEFYKSLQVSGPNNDGAKNPLTSTGYWTRIPTNASPHAVGQWVSLRNSSPPTGYYVRNGALIENASTTVPKLWAYLQEEANAEQCITQAQWTAKQAATYTLSDDDETEVPIWNGVGGVPFYVLDVEADTLRLPDTRGMYAEDSGFDGLTVGGVHGDIIRNITGTVGGSTMYWGEAVHQDAGAFYAVMSGENGKGATGFNQGKNYLDTSRVVPTGNANKPRGYGMLGCVYAG